MRNRKYIICGTAVFSIFFLTEGCSTRQMNKEQLSKYIQQDDNGLMKKEGINGIDVRVSYQPKDMLLCQETEGGKLTKQMIDSIRSKYESQEYFTIGLSK